MSPRQHLKLHVCDCNRINLTYGSVTMHFDKEEFLAYAMHVGKMASQVSSAADLQKTRARAEPETTHYH